MSCNCRDSDVEIIAEFRINNRIVPEQKRQSCIAMWTQSAQKKNIKYKFLQIMSVKQETVQKKQNIVAILTTESRICHNKVMIVKWLNKIGWLAPEYNGKHLNSYTIRI